MEKKSLIRLVSFFSIIFLCLVCVSIWVAPYFTLAMLSIFLIVLLFIMSERWTTHDANEFENRFWSFVAFVMSITLVYVVDSPLHFCRHLPGLAFLIIFATTYSVHIFDRYLRRLSLRTMPNINRNQSINFPEQPQKMEAQRKLACIEMLMKKIDPNWFSSAFINTFRVMEIESEIINIFSEATSYELDFLIKGYPLGLIFYKIKDHRFLNGYHRTKLLKLLTVDRVIDLNLYSRALVLHGLQQMKLSAHAQAEQFAKTVILKTNLDDLSDLKCLMDSKGDFNSMHKLLYVDIRDRSVKEEVNYKCVVRIDCFLSLRHSGSKGADSPFLLCFNCVTDPRPHRQECSSAIRTHANGHQIRLEPPQAIRVEENPLRRGRHLHLLGWLLPLRYRHVVP